MKIKKYTIKLFSLLLVLSLLAGCADEATPAKGKKKSSSSKNNSISSDSSDSTQDDTSSENSSDSSSDDTYDSLYDSSDTYAHPRPWVDGNYSPPAYIPSGSTVSQDTSSSSSSSNSSSNDNKPVEKPKYNKAGLLKLVEYMNNNTDNYAIGIHLYGSLDVRGGIRSFEKSTGKKPAYIDFDMNNLEFVTSSAVRTAVSNLTSFAVSGGFVAISDHWLTPTKNYKESSSGGANNSRYELTRKQYYETMTAGTELNKNFLDELSFKVDFLKQLKENGVPVIYRPLHEANGSWFWWGINDSKGITGADVANLYKYVHDYFTVKNGLDNILWEFCTAVAGKKSGYCDWYAGDNYVDILSTDWYAAMFEIQNPEQGSYKDFYNGTIAACGNKPYAVAELGGDGTYDASKYPLKDTLAALESRIDNGTKMAFVGLYFELNQDKDYSLPTRAVTLEQMSDYWSKSGK